jgi:hypothetical protein
MAEVLYGSEISHRFWGLLALLWVVSTSYTAIVPEALSSTDRIMLLADLETGEVIQANPNQPSGTAGRAVALCAGGWFNP